MFKMTGASVEFKGVQSLLDEPCYRQSGRHWGGSRLPGINTRMRKGNGETFKVEPNSYAYHNYTHIHTNIHKLDYEVGLPETHS